MKPRHPITEYPCRYMILIHRPKSMGGDTEALSYGASDQPNPERLLGRGFGCLFKTKKEAYDALDGSLAADKGHAYVKKCWFQVVPVYQTWGRRAKA